MLTSQDIAKAQFMTVRLKEGYDMGEVDDFLDRLVATLEKYEQGVRDPSGTVTSAEVQTHQFATVRVREGYDLREVDELLDHAAQTLETLESQPAPAPAPPAASAPAPPAASAPDAFPRVQPSGQQFPGQALPGQPVPGQQVPGRPFQRQPPPGQPTGSTGGLSTFELVQQLLSLYAGAGPSVWAVGPDGRRYEIEGVKATTSGLTITLSD